MKRCSILLWAAIVCSLLLPYSTARAASDTAPLATPTAPALGGDFTLTDHHGQPFKLTQERGKVVLLFFGYTHCPDVCPDSLAKMAKVLKALGDDAAKVSALFISVDPERDTVEHLNNYVPFFSPQLIGLTGTPAEIKTVAEAYHAQFKSHKKQGSAVGDAANDSVNYSVDHNPNIFVLDQQGKVDNIINYGLPMDHILGVVQAMLKTPVKPALQAPFDKDTATGTLDLPDLAGKMHALADYQGHPLMINFWASWCPPCRAELPALNRAWQVLQADGMVMLAVNVGEEQAAVEQFLRDYPITFPVLLDSAGNSMERWPMKGLPMTFVLDKNGQVVYQAAGAREWDSPAVLAEIRAAVR